MIENNYYFCFDNNSIYKLGFGLICISNKRIEKLREMFKP